MLISPPDQTPALWHCQTLDTPSGSLPSLAMMYAKLLSTLGEYVGPSRQDMVFA